MYSGDGLDFLLQVFLLSNSARSMAGLLSVELKRRVVICLDLA